jgi:hypothetical protein
MNERPNTAMVLTWHTGKKSETLVATARDLELEMIQMQTSMRDWNFNLGL